MRLLLILVLSGCWMNEVEVVYKPYPVRCITDRPPRGPQFRDEITDEPLDPATVLWKYTAALEKWEQKVWKDCMNVKLAPL